MRDGTKKKAVYEAMRELEAETPELPGFTVKEIARRVRKMVARLRQTSDHSIGSAVSGLQREGWAVSAGTRNKRYWTIEAQRKQEEPALEKAPEVVLVDPPAGSGKVTLSDLKERLQRTPIKGQGRTVCVTTRKVEVDRDTLLELLRDDGHQVEPGAAVEWTEAGAVVQW